MYFRNYGLQIRGLEECLKNPISEAPSTTNMGNVHKHCCNLGDRTFTLFIDCCDQKSLGLFLVYFCAMQNLNTFY